jgi:hypothetical protein
VIAAGNGAHQMNTGIFNGNAQKEKPLVVVVRGEASD